MAHDLTLDDENLGQQAHRICGKISNYEKMDLDREAAIEVPTAHYGPLDDLRLEKYFSIPDQLKE